MIEAWTVVPVDYVGQTPIPPPQFYVLIKHLRYIIELIGHLHKMV